MPKVLRDRVAWNGKLKGDTLPRPHRMVNGRRVWAVMPNGAFYVEDTLQQRVIYAGEAPEITTKTQRHKGGTGESRVQSPESRIQSLSHEGTKEYEAGRTGRFAVLARSLEKGGPARRLRIKDPTDRTIRTYPTLSQAMTALWLWVRNQQTPYMRVVEGEIDLD